MGGLAVQGVPETGSVLMGNDSVVAPGMTTPAAH